MKRITALSAAVAMLALSVAAPAGAAPNAGKGAKAQRDIVCVVNADGTTTCTNVSQIGTDDGATQVEVDLD